MASGIEKEPRTQPVKVGRTVGEMRARLGINQTQLAEYIGTTQDYISRVARDEQVPSWELVFKLLSMANKAEADALVHSMRESSTPNRRRDNMARAIRSATAVLMGLANYEQTPDEAKGILKEFLEKWEDWLTKTTWEGRFSTRL